MKIFLYIYILLVLCSCNNRKLHTILAENRYWFYENNIETNYPIFFEFQENGQLEIKYQNEKGNLELWHFSRCNAFEHIWKTEGDSSLYIGQTNDKLPIISFTDSIILLKRDGEKMVLKRVENLKEFMNELSKQRNEIKSQVERKEFSIKILQIKEIGGEYIIHGTDGKQENQVVLNHQEKDVIKPSLDDKLIKHKDAILINKITKDSIFLYGYAFPNRSVILYLLKSGAKKDFSNINGMLQ